MGTPQTSLARQNVVPVHIYALNSFFFLIPPQYISAKLDCHLFLQIYIIFFKLRFDWAVDSSGILSSHIYVYYNCSISQVPS